MRPCPSFVSSILILPLAATLPGQEKVDFVKEIQPIFKARCYECHGGEEEEGDLKLDVKASVFRQDRDQAIVVPGKPKESLLYLRITLDGDDPDIMPAEGDPLTKEQLALIERWIKEGAHWPDGASAAPIKKKAPESIRVPELDASAKQSEEKALQALAQRGATAMYVAKNSNGVYVNLGLLGQKLTDADLALLGGLEPSLVWLNIGRSAVTDEGVTRLAAFKELRRLHLEKTKVTDDGLAALSGLSKLEYLNLYGTQIGDAGLARLQGLGGLKKLYLWQTQVTDAGVGALRKAIPGVQIDRGEYVKALRAVAAEIEARKPVNEVCPVLNKKANANKTFRYKDETIAFCCDKCVAKFAKSPEKFIGKLQRTAVAKKPINDKCPLTGKPVNSKFTALFEGRVIGLCCAKCQARFKKDPKKFADKLPSKKPAAKKPAAEKPSAKEPAARPKARTPAAKVKRTVNEKCLFQDKPVNLEFTHTYRGITVGFCCKRCLARFKRDPEKYIDRVAPPKKQPREPGKARATPKKAPINESCPLTGRPVKADLTVEFDGKTWAVCCRRCLAKVEKEPAKYLGKNAPQAAKPINEKCPFSGRRVLPGAVAIYQGKSIGFCNFACRNKFAAAPQNFPEVLKKVGLDVLEFRFRFKSR